MVQRVEHADHDVEPGLQREGRHVTTDEPGAGHGRGGDREHLGRLVDAGEVEIAVQAGQQRAGAAAELQQGPRPGRCRLM